MILFIFCSSFLKRPASQVKSPLFKAIQVLKLVEHIDSFITA